MSTVANVAISGGGGGYVGPRQGSVTKPSLASFTQVNFNGVHTTAADGVAGITLYDDTALTGWRLLEQAAPATPYDIYAHFGYGTGANNHKCLTLRDTTNGRLIGVGRYEAQTIVTVWNSVTSFAANRVLANGPGMEWVRMHNDGTTITCYLSPNGLDWFKVFAETIASFLVGPMDQMGFGIQMDAGTNGILCDSFSTVAPT